MWHAQDEKRLFERSQQAAARPSSANDSDEHTLDGRRRRTATAKALNSGDADEVFDENEHELFCVCQQPYNADTAMIECDACGEWYHMKCVGLTQVSA